MLFTYISLCMKLKIGLENETIGNISVSLIFSYKSTFLFINFLGKKQKTLKAHFISTKQMSKYLLCNYSTLRGISDDETSQYMNSEQHSHYLAA